MAASHTVLRSGANPEARRRVQGGVIAFFCAVALSLIAIYVLAPRTYTSILGAKVAASENHPLIATVFCGAILLFIAVLIVGVLRRWRWLYWLLVLAFTFSALQIPAGALELTGVLPDPFPAWYTVYRTIVAAAEVGLGTWMLLVWRRWGVWAEGRLPRA
jgi:hypothetical protein